MPKATQRISTPKSRYVNVTLTQLTFSFVISPFSSASAIMIDATLKEKRRLS